MEHGTRVRAGFAFAALLGAVGYAAACQNTSVGDTTSTSSGAAGGATSSSSGSGSSAGGSDGGAITSFTPQSCGFSILPRPEYTDFAGQTPVNGATPNIRRVRLGLGGNVAAGAGHADPATTSAFAWQTDDGTYASVVTWGSDPDPTKWPAANRASGVTWLTPPGSLNGNGPERMHEVYACGLTPATTYYYRVGGGPAASEVWSDVFTFTTTPAAGPTPVTFTITGDSRGEGANAWQILQRRVKVLAPTLQLFSGDMINLAPDQGEWEEWLDRAWKDSNNSYLTLGHILSLEAHGNHDNHTALFYGNLTLPQDVAHFPQYGELFFSVDVGPVHIIMIDDAWICDPSGDQNYQGIFGGWLNADLAAANANRTKVPWIIAMHHHPEYSSSSHGMDADVLLGRQFFGPIWDMYHADLVLAGHDHDYERSLPITGPTSNPTIQPDPSKGTIYMVCAGSGADAYMAGTSTFTAASHDFVSGQALGLYGVLTADAHNLKVEAHELRSDGSDPVFDTLTITK